MTNRITERMILEALSATAKKDIPATDKTSAIPHDVLEDWIKRKIATLDKKKATKRGLTEKEIQAREVENSTVYAVLEQATTGMTPSGIGKVTNPIYSPQKVVAILHRLEKIGKVMPLTEKGVTYWAKVEG